MIRSWTSFRVVPHFEMMHYRISTYLDEQRLQRPTRIGRDAQGFPRRSTTREVKGIRRACCAKIVYGGERGIRPTGIFAISCKLLILHGKPHKHRRFVHLYPCALSAPCASDILTFSFLWTGWTGRFWDSRPNLLFKTKSVKRFRSWNHYSIRADRVLFCQSHPGGYKESLTL
jgi:hypothetical protein